MKTLMFWITHFVKNPATHFKVARLRIMQQSVEQHLAFQQWKCFEWYQQTCMSSLIFPFLKPIFQRKSWLLVDVHWILFSCILLTGLFGYTGCSETVFAATVRSMHSMFVHRWKIFFCLFNFHIGMVKGLERLTEHDSMDRKYRKQSKSHPTKTFHSVGCTKVVNV